MLPADESERAAHPHSRLALLGVDQSHNIETCMDLGVDCFVQERGGQPSRSRCGTGDNGSPRGRAGDKGLAERGLDLTSLRGQAATPKGEGRNVATSLERRKVEGPRQGAVWRRWRGVHVGGGRQRWA